MAYYLLHQLGSPKLGQCPFKTKLLLPAAKLLSLTRQFDNVSATEPDDCHFTEDSCICSPLAQEIEDEIVAVLMQPGIVDDLEILRFAKTHKLVAEWPAFLRRLAKCLLLVPMKVRFHFHGPHH